MTQYNVNDIVEIDMGDDEFFLVRITEVHDGHYSTKELSEEYDAIHGELYDDDDNHRLLSRGC